ncbi:MAG: ABC transporter substrate-binding protein [Solibacillus sp.]
MKKWKLALISLAMGVLVAGCQEESQQTAANEQYVVVDDRQKEVTFESVPETIVSLQPSNTEILFALGVGDRIIGATAYDTYPEQALEIERISDIITVDLERVVQLEPDVVIAYDTLDEAQIAQLEALGLNVFLIESATTLEAVYSDITQLAQVMQVEDKGAAIVSAIQAQIAGVQEKIAPYQNSRAVYYEVSPAPDIWTAGSETFQQELLSAAGINNLFADQTDWFQVSEEEVITRNPAVIMTTANYLDDPIGELKTRNGWESVTAIQTGALHLVDDDLFSRPATRVGDAVEAAAKMVYPEAFN